LLHECELHPLEQSCISSKSVQRLIGMSPLPYKATQNKGVNLPSYISSMLIHLANVDLYSCVIFRMDEAICCGALARDIKLNSSSFFVLHSLYQQDNARCGLQQTSKRSRFTQNEGVTWAWGFKNKIITLN